LENKGGQELLDFGILKKSVKKKKKKQWVLEIKDLIRKLAHIQAAVIFPSTSISQGGGEE